MPPTTPPPTRARARGEIRPSRVTRDPGRRHTHHLDPVARVRPKVDVAPSADEPPVQRGERGLCRRMVSCRSPARAEHHAEPHRGRRRRNFRRVRRQRPHRKSAHAQRRAVVRERQRAPHRKPGAGGPNVSGSAVHRWDDDAPSAHTSTPPPYAAPSVVTSSTERAMAARSCSIAPCAITRLSSRLSEMIALARYSHGISNFDLIRGISGRIIAAGHSSAASGDSKPAPYSQLIWTHTDDDIIGAGGVAGHVAGRSRTAEAVMTTRFSSTSQVDRRARVPSRPSPAGARARLSASRTKRMSGSRRRRSR